MRMVSHQCLLPQTNDTEKPYGIITSESDSETENKSQNDSENESRLKTGDLFDNWEDNSFSHETSLESDDDLSVIDEEDKKKKIEVINLSNYLRVDDNFYSWTINSLPDIGITPSNPRLKDYRFLVVFHNDILKLVLLDSQGGVSINLLDQLDNRVKDVEQIEEEEINKIINNIKSKNIYIGNNHHHLKDTFESKLKLRDFLSCPHRCSVAAEPSYTIFREPNKNEFRITFISGENGKPNKENTVYIKIPGEKSYGATLYKKIQILPNGEIKIFKKIYTKLDPSQPGEEFDTNTLEGYNLELLKENIKKLNISAISLTRGLKSNQNELKSSVMHNGTIFNSVSSILQNEDLCNIGKVTLLAR